MPLELSQFYIFCSLFWNKTIDAVHLVCFEYKDAISIWALIIIKDEYQSLYNIFIQVKFPLFITQFMYIENSTCYKRLYEVNNWWSRKPCNFFPVDFYACSNESRNKRWKKNHKWQNKAIFLRGLVVLTMNVWSPRGLICSAWSKDLPSISNTTQGHTRIKDLSMGHIRWIQICVWKQMKESMDMVNRFEC